MVSVSSLPWNTYTIACPKQRSADSFSLGGLVLVRSRVLCLHTLRIQHKQNFSSGVKDDSTHVVLVPRAHFSDLCRPRHYLLNLEAQPRLREVLNEKVNVVVCDVGIRLWPLYGPDKQSLSRLHICPVSFDLRQNQCLAKKNHKSKENYALALATWWLFRVFSCSNIDGCLCILDLRSYVQLPALGLQIGPTES